MVIIGKEKGNDSTVSYFFDVNLKRGTEGPQLKVSRSGFGCGTIRRSNSSQELSIIVAGGFNGNNSYPGLTSVEILDQGSDEWRAGPGGNTL
jgi:hypothetical protein